MTIYIYLPSRIVGGTELLFFNIIKYLNQNKQDFGIISYPDSVLKSMADNVSFSYTFYCLGQLGQKIEHDSIIITPLGYLGEILFFLDSLASSIRLFFWDVHPFNLIEQLAFSGMYKKLSLRLTTRISRIIELDNVKMINGFLEIGIQKGGVAFMCGKNLKLNRTVFNFNNENTNLIAIPHQIKSTSLTKRELDRDFLHIGWVSRIDDDKYRLLTKVIRVIDHHTKVNSFKEKVIVLHVIGDGNCLQNLEVLKRSLKFKIVIVGRLFNEDLRNYLSNFIDVGISIGTSLFVFAEMRIPVIACSGSNFGLDSRSDKNIRFSWFFQLKDADLSGQETGKNAYTFYSFNLLLDQMFTGDYTNYGLKAYNHLQLVHSYKVIMPDFYKKLLSSRLSIGDVKSVFESNRIGLGHFLNGIKYKYKKYHNSKYFSY